MKNEGNQNPVQNQTLAWKLSGKYLSYFFLFFFLFSLSHIHFNATYFYVIAIKQCELYSHFLLFHSIFSLFICTKWFFIKTNKSTCFSCLYILFCVILHALIMILNKMNCNIRTYVYVYYKGNKKIKSLASKEWLFISSQKVFSSINLSNISESNSYDITWYKLIEKKCI